MGSEAAKMNQIAQVSHGKEPVCFRAGRWEVNGGGSPWACGAVASGLLPGPAQPQMRLWMGCSVKNIIPKEAQGWHPPRYQGN